ncbi:hypothetical protein EWB00_001835, partial [Schistosoma japonicum]
VTETPWGPEHKPSLAPLALVRFWFEPALGGTLEGSPTPDALNCPDTEELHSRRLYTSNITGNFPQEPGNTQPPPSQKHGSFQLPSMLRATQALTFLPTLATPRERPDLWTQKQDFQELSLQDSGNPKAT